MRRSHSQHYCRSCEFVVAPTSGYPTAHAQMQAHLFREHGSELTVACTKYCQEAEQPEERSLGHKRYGPGSRAGRPAMMTYDQLFPVEEDDHS
jgi:hypothetical protein